MCCCVVIFVFCFCRHCLYEKFYGIGKWKQTLGTFCPITIIIPLLIKSRQVRGLCASDCEQEWAACRTPHTHPWAWIHGMCVCASPCTEHSHNTAAQGTRITFNRCLFKKIYYQSYWKLLLWDFMLHNFSCCVLPHIVVSVLVMWWSI